MDRSGHRVASPRLIYAGVACFVFLAVIFSVGFLMGSSNKTLTATAAAAAIPDTTKQLTLRASSTLKVTTTSVRLASTTTRPPTTTAAPATTATAIEETTTSFAVSVVEGGPTEEQWAALRNCEATNNYQAVNSAGPYFGAYQFNQSTWDGVAARAGRPDLVGLRPIDASNSDQDQMAKALHSERGWQPWPRCRIKLGFP